MTERSISRPHARPRPRLRVLAAIAAFPLLTALAGCGAEAAAGPHLTLDKPLPTSVPKESKLVVGDPQTEVALELSGQKDKFTFDLEFVQLFGGPQTTEAFRAEALDVGAVADIPPIHATFTGLDVRIVAAEYRQDPLEHPIYELGIKPGTNVKTLADLKGKKIAYSPGQAQGALILRVLKKAGLDQDDVELVELPSNGDVYSTALAAGEVDVAPIGSTQIKRYLANYGKDGATTIRHGLRDDPGHLYVRQDSLEDAHKAAAIREYVQRWAIAQKWIDEHPKEWLEGYYIKDQGLSREDGEFLIKAAGHPDIPTDWTDHIAEHQETIDLVAEENDQDPFEAGTIWDRRFEQLGGEAFESGKLS